MKLIEAHFSWEVNPELGEYDIVYTSLRAAKRDALFQVKDRMKDSKENQDTFDTHDVPIDPLKVEIDVVQVDRLSPTLLAYVINNAGRGWRVAGSERRVMEITFSETDKKPVVKTFKESK